MAELQSPENLAALNNPKDLLDEKNIRRRVYDALNVLMAMNIIAKEKKARRPTRTRTAPPRAGKAPLAGR